MFSRVAAATLQLLRFKAGPQDFPYDKGLTLPIIAATVLVNFMQGSFIAQPAVALAEAITVVLVTIAFTQFALQFKKLTNRAQQTVNSLLAANTALTCFSIPVMIWFGPALQDLLSASGEGQQPRSLPPGMFLLSLLGFWNLAVSANIFRHALDVGLFLGFGVAFASLLMAASLVTSVGQLLGG